MLHDETLEDSVTDPTDEDLRSADSVRNHFFDQLTMAQQNLALTDPLLGGCCCTLRRHGLYTSRQSGRLKALVGFIIQNSPERSVNREGFVSYAAFRALRSLTNAGSSKLDKSDELRQSGNYSQRQGTQPRAMRKAAGFNRGT